MQSMHNRGLAIDSVAFTYGSGEASTPAPVATAADAPKAEAKKPARRAGRRKRG
jgi:hypothetical protein